MPLRDVDIAIGLDGEDAFLVGDGPHCRLIAVRSGGDWCVTDAPASPSNYTFCAGLMAAARRSTRPRSDPDGGRDVDAGWMAATLAPHVSGRTDGWIGSFSHARRVRQVTGPRVGRIAFSREGY